MTNSTVKTYNVSNGKITEREMTDAEYAQQQADKSEHLATKAKAEAKAAAREALLARLGITADEAALLLG